MYQLAMHIKFIQLLEIPQQLKHDSHLRSFESKSAFLNCISIKIAAVDCNTANSIKFELSLFVIESLHMCNFFHVFDI